MDVYITVVDKFTKLFNLAFSFQKDMSYMNMYT